MHDMALYRSHRIDKPTPFHQYRVDPCHAARRNPLNEARTSGPDEKTADGGGFSASANALHRVDEAHATNPTSFVGEPSQPCQTAQPFQTAQPYQPDQPSAASHQGWLHRHGEDLVQQLQRWAEDLDAREAQLNARAALQEHHERQFRVHKQATLTDLAEQTRAAEHAQSELRAQARRLAFES
ncbi:hypothetical protein [Novipirellula artificiosorum]|uniref:hypothetical protein n=1 Tax=Novipirellula artificiosorum TaxID=2528016 RepID=UPI0011B599E1|nr:hypothetical protein [Novipirellula artificiosorum]